MVTAARSPISRAARTAKRSGKWRRSARWNRSSWWERRTRSRPK
jgi:hypothetical protein